MPINMLPGWADGIQNLPDVASGIMRILNPKLDLQLATRNNMAMHPELAPVYANNEALHPGSTRKWLGDSHLTDMIEKLAENPSPDVSAQIATRDTLKKALAGQSLGNGNGNSAAPAMPATPQSLFSGLANNPGMTGTPNFAGLMNPTNNTATQPQPQANNGLPNTVGSIGDLSLAGEIIRKQLNLPDAPAAQENFYRGQNFAEDAKLAPVRARLIEAQTSDAELKYADNKQQLDLYNAALAKFPNPSAQRVATALENNTSYPGMEQEYKALGPEGQKLVTDRNQLYNEAKNRAAQLTLESMRKQSTDKQSGLFFLQALNGRRAELQDRIVNANRIVSEQGKNMMIDQATASSSTDPNAKQAAQARIAQYQDALKVVNQSSEENQGLKELDSNYKGLYNSIAGKFGIKPSDIKTPTASGSVTTTGNGSVDPTVVKQVYDRIKSGNATIEDFSRTKNPAITPAVIAAVKSQLGQPEGNSLTQLGNQLFSTPEQRKKALRAKTDAQTKANLDVLLGNK